MSSVQALVRYDDLYPEYEKSKDGLKVSEAEYWKTYYEDPDFSYEWNNGRLEEKPMSDRKGDKVKRWFCYILESYFASFPIGGIISSEIGFRIHLPHKVSVRIPDLAVILDGNPENMDDDDRSYKGTFDLCIESLSHSVPKEILRDTVTKKKEYEGIGVKEYYILDAREHETAFYSLDKGGKYQKIKPVEGGIIKSGIMPGFQFRESDLYRRPLIDELVDDAVYWHYVFPSHKQKIDKEKQRADKADQRAEREKQRADKADQRIEQEKQRAEQEKQRADEADQRAKQERQRSEQLAAKLRELGISPE